MSARDSGYEREFLERAEQEAGLMGLGFPDQVLERLDNYGRVYGDRWAGLTLGQLVAEIRLEAMDLGGWPVLTAQRALSMNGSLDDEKSMHLRMMLQAIAAKGAEVENLCRQVAVLLAE